MPAKSFESMLSGGHPNSLGRTLDVVALVLADKSRLKALFDCYRNADPVVRMRTSNALKRICRAEPECLVPWLDHLIAKVSRIEQASAQWTLATLFQLLEAYMRTEQKNRARRIMQTNLEHFHDWIVLNTTMDTLAAWSERDKRLKSWLLPRLQRLRHDKRGSVARKAAKISARLKT